MDPRRTSNNTVSELARRILTIACVTATCASAATAASGATPRLTVSEYRAQANSICHTVNVQFDRSPPAATLPGILAAAVKAENAVYLQVRRLNPPQALTTLTTEVLTTMKREVALGSALLAKAKRGQLTESELHKDIFTGAIEKESNREDALWKKIGALTCAAD